MMRYICTIEPSYHYITKNSCKWKQQAK